MCDAEYASRNIEQHRSFHGLKESDISKCEIFEVAKKECVCVRRTPKSTSTNLKNIFFETNFSKKRKTKNVKLKMCQVFVC